ncbi:uncharacterized protein LOC135397915 [Ornithodoros turicata]|uniref:uncharacterized protein LOC135397915 n=1 Tax=Ornithodoros turicata TaxID=34597 RepID=UPI0031395D1C
MFPRSPRPVNLGSRAPAPYDVRTPMNLDALSHSSRAPCNKLQYKHEDLKTGQDTEETATERFGSSETSGEEITEPVGPATEMNKREDDGSDDILSEVEESNALQAVAIAAVCLLILFGLIVYFQGGSTGRRHSAMAVDGESKEGKVTSAPGYRKGHLPGPYAGAKPPRRRSAVDNRRSDDNEKGEAYTRRTTESAPTSYEKPTATDRLPLAVTRTVHEIPSLETTATTTRDITMVRASTSTSDDEKITPSVDDEPTPLLLPPITKKTRPLVCVTTQLGKRSSFAEDGLCDYLVFRDVTLGDGEWVSATSSAQLHPFLDRSLRSLKTIHLLSFPANIHPEVTSFLRTNAVCVQLFGKYLMKNIRGYGFASVDVDTNRFLKDAPNYRNVMKELHKTMLSATSTGGITLLGLLLRGKRNAKVFGALKEMTKHTDIFIAISHTPLPVKNSNCLVRPITSWSSEHLNDVTVQTLSSALGLLKGNSNRNSTTFALSSSLGVLKFKTHPESDRGIEGIWNVRCTEMVLEAFQNECTVRTTVGGIGTNDHIVYDFDKRNRIWRSYETVDSLRTKIEKVFDDLHPNREDLFGWALYDVDLEDQKGVCNAVMSGKYQGNPNNRLMWVKEFLLDKKSLGTN